MLAGKLRFGGLHDNRCMKKEGGMTRYIDFFFHCFFFNGLAVQGTMDNPWRYMQQVGRCTWIREGLRSKHGCEATADGWKRILFENGVQRLLFVKIKSL